MKKKSRRLALHRETLRSLENLRGVGGGGSIAVCLTGRGTGTRNCDGTYDLCGQNTYENCSNHCQTGGACTMTDVSCGSCDPICYG